MSVIIGGKGTANVSARAPQCRDCLYYVLMAV